MLRKSVLFLCTALLLITFGNSKRSAAAPATSPEAVVPPTITTQPANATVALGKTATFSVVASGTTTLYYQWYKNGGKIDGAAQSTYKTPPTTDADNDSYFTVIVKNSAG